MYNTFTDESPDRNRTPEKSQHTPNGNNDAIVDRFDVHEIRKFNRDPACEIFKNEKKNSRCESTSNDALNESLQDERTADKRLRRADELHGLDYFPLRVDCEPDCVCDEENR